MTVNIQRNEKSMTMAQIIKFYGKKEKEKNDIHDGGWGWVRPAAAGVDAGWQVELTSGRLGLREDVRVLKEEGLGRKNGVEMCVQQLKGWKKIGSKCCCWGMNQAIFID